MELVRLEYTVERYDARWELEDDVTIPESTLHDCAVDLLKALLREWVLRRSADAVVGRNIAVRWDQAHPRVGVDPDVAVFEPAPSNWNALRSVCTWRAGEAPPRIAVEVVSENDPRKDYSLAPEKHAASGAKEFWVFDPLLAGPSAHGGPHRLQLWRRTARGLFRRVYAGAGPALSRELGAWLVPLETPEGWMLRIANDAGGRDLWLTGEERERAEKERERAEKNAMEQRVKELEAELARLGGRPKRR